MFGSLQQSRKTGALTRDSHHAGSAFLIGDRIVGEEREWRGAVSAIGQSTVKHPRTLDLRNKVDVRVPIERYVRCASQLLAAGRTVLKAPQTSRNAVFVGLNPLRTVMPSY